MFISGGFGLDSDYNVELVIALEMSRLQMIEDRMKQAQANAITPDPASSISNNSNESIDDQLKLAIQLSLQESNPEPNHDQDETTRNAALTVDYFLKSLTNRRLGLKDVNVITKGNREALWMNGERDYFFKPCSRNEDGRFQISEIHEKGFSVADSDDFDNAGIRLKRSHSTGDLCIRRNGEGTRTRANPEELRYHLDSDHSSQHDEKPEDIARKLLALPSTSVKAKQFFLLHQTNAEEKVYQGQSSIEDTVISDSMNADLEVVSVLESITDEYVGGKYGEEASKRGKREVKIHPNISKSEETKKHNPFASLKAKICSAHLPRGNYLTKIAVNKSIGLLSEERENRDEGRRNSDHGLQLNRDTLLSRENQSPKSLKNMKCNGKRTSFSKSTGFLTEKKESIGKTVSSKLRIKICRSPEHKYSKNQTLETDSSNEYESETGIPKSPTLFISGVSILRTPEPGVNHISGKYEGLQYQLTFRRFLLF